MKFLDDKGNIAVMAAMTMPLVIGGAGLGVETGYWYYEQLRLQQAADAAAYAAALEQRGGSTFDETLAGAQAAAISNGYQTATGTIDVNTPSAFAAGEENSVDVALTRTVPRAFSAIFGEENVTISARATAAYSTAANACVLALDKSASPAISFSGNAEVDLNGCVIMSNSMAAQSIIFDGNSDVAAPCIMAVGGYQKKSNAQYSTTTCSDVMTDQPAAGDPYKDMPYPSYGACTSNCNPSVGGNGSGTFNPGTYSSLSISANATGAFNPGIYIINGGTLSISGNAKASGSGVTFVLVNGASADFGGNTRIQFSAPTTGTYKGMLFMGSRTSGAGGMSTFNGNNQSFLEGALYFPKQAIAYNGNFDGNKRCTQIVARTISWSGNAQLDVNCSAAGLEPIVAGSSVRLVG